MSRGVTLSNTHCVSTPDEQERMSRVPYALTIGSIMYAMICTHPDVSYALTVTSRY
jgi:ATP-binding cassette subfamily B (MDR/TAP) protein 1